MKENMDKAKYKVGVLFTYTGFFGVGAVLVTPLTKELSLLKTILMVILSLSFLFITLHQLNLEGRLLDYFRNENRGSKWFLRLLFIALAIAWFFAIYALTLSVPFYTVIFIVVVSIGIYIYYLVKCIISQKKR